MNPMDQFLSKRTRQVIRDISGVSKSLFISVILCLVCSPCMSAPAGPPIWVNPCGGNVPPSGPHHDTAEFIPPTVRELLTGVIIAGKSALDYAETFLARYVRKTFKQDFMSHHRTWATTRYPWLPSKTDIPKDLGQPLPKSHFGELQGLDKTLLQSYYYLQRIAVGLEQVYHDKRREGDEFTAEFEAVMYKLRQVLCEVQTVLLERNPDLVIEDIERSIMEPEYRNITETTYRHLRDWFIYRDYMNCLEYLIEVSEYYKAAATPPNSP